MFEKVQNNPNNILNKVEEEKVLLAEERMGLLIPDELRKFYLQVGCGKIYSLDNSINRLMGPLSCADIRLREDVYEYDPDLEVYELYEDDKMIFFEINEGVYALIELSNNEHNKIYFADELIADSLEEFLEKIEDSNYWNNC